MLKYLSFSPEIQICWKPESIYTRPFVEKIVPVGLTSVIFWRILSPDK
jgi:hypothetical protein